MASHDPKRPNVVVILTDDQGAWALGCAGNTELRTPNLDRLAAQGARLTRYFCVSPVCSPARATIMTGRIPSQHGVHDWLRAGNSPFEPENDGRVIDYLEGQTTYPEVLAAHGYACGLSGKWHLGDCHRPHRGFGFWQAHTRGGGSYYAAPMARGEDALWIEPRYVTDAITDQALNFLATERDTPRPFYLSVHYTAPHGPWDRSQHPPEIFDSYFRDCPFRSVPDLPRHPWLQAEGGLYEGAERRREVLSGYYAAITAMDANVGRLLAALESSGLRENTLVVFLSDNGMNMGHHGICGKGNGTRPLNMYDSSVLVPCLLSQPGRIPAGLTSDAMFCHADVFPTLLDYVGLPNPVSSEIPGISFAPLLRGESVSGRDHVVVFNEYGRTRMIRSRTHKYVHRYPDGPHELYDLASDPGETRNLWGEREQSRRVAELRGEMEPWFARYVVPARDGTRKLVSGWGQVSRCELPQTADTPFTLRPGTRWWPEGVDPKPGTVIRLKRQGV